MRIVGEKEFSVRRWSDLADIDWYLLGSVITIIFFSLLLLTSAGDGAYFGRQLFFLIFALIVGISTLFIKIRFWEESSKWFYIINILLLVFVMIKGASAMGAQRWIDLGPIRIQPSEIAKISIIISLASWFSKRPINSYTDIFMSFLIIGPPFILIFKQPDLGTSLAFIAIYFGMAFWAGATITHLLVGISPIVSLITNATGEVSLNIGAIQIHHKVIELNITQNFIYFLVFLVAWLIINYKPWKSPWIVLSVSSIVFANFVIGFIRPILWNFLHTYQQKRLTIFLDPESDPQGAGYHIIQSLLAIGNGGFFGYGWKNGKLTKGDYVPAQHTDFIFSSCGEEFGFWGASLMVILFCVILFRAVYIARNSNDRFSSLVAIGIFSFFAFHIFINIGMTLGIMPITGVPLPFLSYGGTALLVDLFSAFLLLSISSRTLPKKMF